MAQEFSIAKLLKLAALDLSAKEQRSLEGELDLILQSFASLQNVNTQEVEPLYSLSENEKRLREDVPKLRLKKEDILANAPNKSGAFYRVGRVVGAAE